MSIRRRFAGILVAGPIAAVLTLAAAPLPAQHLVPGEDPEFPRIQFPDSLYSLNDRCIVRLRKLSVRLPAAYVNGLPIGFC